MTTHETKHTPGPWRIVPGGGHANPSVCGSDSIHTNGRQRNSLGISSTSYSDEVCQFFSDLSLEGPAANARLIASAPDLLAALKECEGYFDNRETSEEAWDLMMKCRAAISKAEGGQ